MKPFGLWYSVEGTGEGWSDWCRAEEFCDTDAQVAHAIALDMSRVLVIDNGIDLRAFEREYHRPHPVTTGLVSWIYHIDWALVAARYGGIEIAPYQWQHRHNAMWYYGWDCASGCVWDIDAIRSFEPMARAA